MRRAAEALGDILMQAHAWHGIAEAQAHWGDMRGAIENAAHEESLARQIGAKVEITKALWLKAWASFRLGEMETVLPLAEQVAELSHDLHDSDQMAHSLNLLGVLKSASGRFQEATRHFEEALEIFSNIGNRRRATPLMNNLGVIAEARGDYQEARRRYQEALDTAREIGNRDGEMVYLSNLGGVKVHQAEYISAEADLKQVIEMAGAEKMDVLSVTYSFLANAYLGQNKVSEALPAAQRALDLAEETESQDDLGLVWRVLGLVAAALAEPVTISLGKEGQTRTLKAEEFFFESERIFNEIEKEEERARTLREWAKYKLAEGDYQQGMRMWDEAKEIFMQLGALPEVERMEENYAR
jgi:tetratricopeptide (TPR) repeat protein